MSEFRSENPADDMRVVEFEGIGEITVGGTTNQMFLVVMGLCVQNNPQTNKFFLANKLNLVDRMTKTKIFPREGMALPDGGVYEEPEKEKVLTLPDTEN